MRSLNSNEVEQVSGAGFLSSILSPKSSGAAASTPCDDFTDALNNLLSAVGSAFNKVADILNQYTNMFSGSSKKG
ncbi:hypothetical protein QNH14_17565 [Apirhabdus apintestini]|uniref:hypothetical protein n=1 Tax=Erwinia sp. HR93 TaxID=3094840 RepID=UPI002ADED710|nr:hypothetical protein [Erwinia sp. HR93]MEA1062544.1 hypothetical protein [Erwinia sp. HR93]WPM84485.1 hypothetical protein QNH14_17565 [Enterobacteriaceae bacterium CA-0114]